MKTPERIDRAVMAALSQTITERVQAAQDEDLPGNHEFPSSDRNDQVQYLCGYMDGFLAVKTGNALARLYGDDEDEIFDHIIMLLTGADNPDEALDLLEAGLEDDDV